MKGAWLAALVALSSTVPTKAPAQRAQSVEMGFLTAFEEDVLFLIGYRVTYAPRGAGVDFSIAIWPEGLFDVGLLLLPHLDLTAPVAIGSRSWLLPRVGLSGIIGASSEGGGGLFGLNVGIGLMGRLNERHGLRLDVTHMRLFEQLGEADAVGLTTFSVGFAWIK